MQRCFEVLAASHGAAGIGLIALFSCAGVVTLFELESRTAIGMCLTFIAIAYAAARVFFGFFTRTSDK
jgi:hypothetical protein